MLRGRNQRQATEIGIDNRSVMCILHKELHFYTYKLIIGQQLKPGNYARRLNFAWKIEPLFDANENPILLNSDEAYLYLNHLMNQHKILIRVLRIRENCTKGQCVAQNGRFDVLLVEPVSLVFIFFDLLIQNLFYLLFSPVGKLGSLSFTFIMKMFLRWTPSLCLNDDGNVFLYDVYGFSRMVPSKSVHQWTFYAFSSVNSSFPDLLTLSGPIRSPDLSMGDYSIWRKLKARMYVPKTRTMEAIHMDVAQIDRSILEKVEDNFQEELQKGIIENAHHMSDVGFSTSFCRMFIQY